MENYIEYVIEQEVCSVRDCKWVVISRSKNKDKSIEDYFDIVNYRKGSFRIYEETRTLIMDNRNEQN